jgi:nucleotide-binding universal stress UspA family protein
LNVLVAVDGSQGSDNAVDAVVQQFAPDRTELRVVHADQWNSGLPASLAFGEGATAVDDLLAYRDERKHQAQALVTQSIERISAAGFRVTSLVLEGDPRHVIVDEARAWPADLIVLGSHGRTGLTRLLLGSVSDSVSRHASCSVQIVREPPAHADRLKVLLAVDGSVWSERAAEVVAGQFIPDRLDVRVVHADGWPANPPAPELVTLYEERRRQAHDLVAGVSRRLTNAGVSATGILRRGDARQVILDVAQEWAADLIVVGSHGRTGLGRALLGSVSDAVARHAHCSVHVVRRPPEAAR